jgi:hypothetical protein
MKTIQEIPILSAKMLADLVALCKTAVLSGARSVKCLHAPSASGQHLPEWVVPYWAEVLKIRTTSHKAWVRAEEFIRMRKKVWKKMTDGKSTDMIMQEAYDMLSCLPWSGDVHGFDASKPLYKLATYASHEWLATTHEN